MKTTSSSLHNGDGSLSNGDSTFFVPGPTEVRRDILEAMLRPVVSHRSTEFVTLVHELQIALQHILGTNQPVMVVGSSGTGLMEAAIRNSPEGTILCIDNGAFAARFASIARSCGRVVDVLECGWGEVVSAEMLNEALRKCSYAAVTVVHSETSTGALTNIEPLAKVAHDSGALLLVDAVSSAGGVELSVDRSNADFVFTASQKALALPPGLAFAVASERFIKANSRSANNSGTYFSLNVLLNAARKHTTAFTPPVSLLYAAHKQCTEIASLGISVRAARHNDMSNCVQNWLAVANADNVALTPLATTLVASPTVSVLQLPIGFNSAEVVRTVSNRGFTISTGYGKHEQDTVRIGHMGDHTVASLQKCISAIESALLEIAQLNNTANSSL